MRLSARPTLLLGTLAVSACTSPSTLVGFPHYDHTNPKQAASDLTKDVKAIERKIRTRSSRDESPAYRALLDAYLSMSNEWAGLDPFSPSYLWRPRSFYVRPQGQRLGRPPLQMFPRITNPAMVEPVSVGSWTKWFIPIILCRSSFGWEESDLWNWMGVGGSGDATDGVKHVSFWLEEHNNRPISSRAVFALGSPVSLGGVQVPVGQRDDKKLFCLPDGRPDAMGLVFCVDGRDPPSVPFGYRGTLFPEGFFDVRMLPLIHVSQCESQFAKDLGSGDWYSFHERLKRALGRADRGGDVVCKSLGLDRPQLRELASRIRRHPLGYFQKDLEKIAAALDDLAVALGPFDGDPTGRGKEEMRRRLGVLISRIHSLLEHDWHPCPVLIEPKADGDCYSFVVAGDVQYDANLDDFRAFLSVLDPNLSPRVVREDGAGLAGPSPTDLERIRKASFVLVAGDLGDGAALSSSFFSVVGNFFGVAAPDSPYSEKGYSGEYPELRGELDRFSKPLFAVPGNHDGLVGYGGAINQGLEFVSSLLRLVPGPTYAIGEAIAAVNERTPVLVAFPTMLQLYPMYDGLLEWSFELGPKNLAFSYRGQSFIGINSYDLLQQERGSAGGVAFNWGGGLDVKSVIWFEVVSWWLQSKTCQYIGDSRQFLFMHHDPRAGTPRTSTQQTVTYGNYDHMESPGNIATLGFGGLGFSTFFPIYVPVLTPLMFYLTRYTAYGEKFQQEWMASSVWSAGVMGDLVFNHRADPYYNAEPFVQAINRRLGVEEAGDGGLTHVFMAHDDVPSLETWVHDDEGRAVFPASKWEQEGPPKVLDIFKQRWLFRTQDPGAPQWAREMEPVEGRKNATVVRVDDVGQSGSPHGFHLVTVHPNWRHCRCPGSAKDKQRARIEWFPIP